MFRNHSHSGMIFAILVLFPFFLANARGEALLELDGTAVLGKLNYEGKDGPAFYSCSGNRYEIGSRSLHLTTRTCEAASQRDSQYPPPWSRGESNRMPRRQAGSPPRPPGCTYCDAEPVTSQTGQLGIGAPTF